MSFSDNPLALRRSSSETMLSIVDDLLPDGSADPFWTGSFQEASAARFSRVANQGLFGAEGGDQDQNHAFLLEFPEDQPDQFGSWPLLWKPLWA